MENADRKPTENNLIFHELTPDVVLNLVEASTHKRLKNICWTLTSYINRVYELQTEEGEGIIIKFYRPGRWTKGALADEHTFLLELADQEIPVVPPLKNNDGETLFEHDGMYFALFPKKSGRPCDEPSDEQWSELGRMLARVHNVGASRAASERIRMHPESSTRDNIDYIIQGGFIQSDFRAEYEAAAMGIVEMVTPLFNEVESIRIHGDCHKANIVHRPGESLYVIDFDDMAMGPPVQDFWMLLPGYSRESLLEIDLFLEGYETFRPFDKKTLRLIEPLRAMRYIHFTAWCAMQVADGGFKRIAPDWGEPSYWRKEIADLRNQLDEIRVTLASSSGYPV